jgi:hypothetical protein
MNNHGLSSSSSSGEQQFDEHEHKSLGRKVKDFFTGKYHKEKKEKKRLEKLEREGIAPEHKAI